MGRPILALLLLLTLLAGCQTAKPVLNSRLESLAAEPLDGGRPAAWSEIQIEDGYAIIVRIQVIAISREQL